MPVDRPTFHESWYRVVDQHPSLRPTVQTYRQMFRGQTWHVVRDPSNNQFFRLSEDAYHFVGLLDSRRTVGEAWDLCNDQLGDRAPTQGEVIQILGQLYSVNLLRGDLPPDVQSVFDRFKKRRAREVGGYLTNFLFVRIPLFDPDRILDLFVGVFGWVFSPVGFALWLGLLGAAGYHLVGHWNELISGVDSVLDPSNLISLSISFWIIKAIHEFGHGFANKKFGRISGDGGEMHVMGIMLLVFMPVPYVDASSSWAFRSKWHRALVGAAGIYVELAVASIAAVVWANTTGGTTLHAMMYNIMFIASVSTILFNGNPLLRFDGYYILSDVLEIPNLYQRSRDRLYYLVKKYAYGVRNPRNPAYARGEQIWFVVYAIAAFIYRIFISIRIILFIAGKFFYLGVAMGILAIIMWLLVPLGKWLKFLSTSPELSRTRPRAVGASVMTTVVIIAMLGALPVPDRGRAEGVVAPRRLAQIHLKVDGFVEQIQSSGVSVEPEGLPVVIARNRDLELQRDQLVAEAKLTRVQMRGAGGSNEPARAAVLWERLDSINEKLAYITDQIESLRVKAPFEGVWISPDADRLSGVFLRPADEIGMVAGTSDLVLEIVADQWIGPRINSETDLGDKVDIRVKGNPDLKLTGRISDKDPAGAKTLPSAALGYLAGGTHEVSMDDPEGRTATKPVFRVMVDPDSGSASIQPGQRVVALFQFGSKPLAFQWWRVGRQLFAQQVGQ